MARTNSAVMAEFRSKAGIGNRAIKKRRDKLLENGVPMPSDIATYVAAYEAGVNLGKHLDADTLRTVAEHVQLVRTTNSPAPQPTVAQPPAKRGRRRDRPQEEVQLRNVTVPPGCLSAQALTGAKRMAERVYPLLYVFENSVREFVDGHLTAKYGKDWWDRPKLVSSGPRAAYQKNKGAQGKNRWVERKATRPIYYTELGHLTDIITSQDGWAVFKSIFHDQSWVREHVRSIEVPRNVVAHMNPLLEKNIKGLEVRAQEWFDQIRDHPLPT